jgi:hypothetical protein
VLIRPAELERIRSGEIDLAFRRWERPRLLVGTRMRTPVGLVEITSVDEVAESALTDAEAVRAGADDREALLKLLVPRPERPIFRIGLRYAGADPRIALREGADLSQDERSQLRSRLARLDAASRHGPWTDQTLRIIARRPGIRAPDLAAELGLETVVFKRDVRKLKELGLTESLPVGYRLAPRGRALLDG